MAHRGRDSGYELNEGLITTPVNFVSSITVAQDQTSLIAARSGFSTRILSLAATSGSVVAGSLQKLIFQSIGAATSALTGTLYVPAAGLTWPYQPNGWFQGASNSAIFFSAQMGSGSLQVQACCIAD